VQKRNLKGGNKKDVKYREKVVRKRKEPDSGKDAQGKEERRARQKVVLERRVLRGRIVKGKEIRHRMAPWDERKGILKKK